MTKPYWLLCFCLSWCLSCLLAHNILFANTQAPQSAHIDTLFATPKLTTKISRSKQQLHIFHIQHQSPERIVEFIKKNKAQWLSPGATLYANQAQHQVWIADSPAHIQQLKRIIDTLDQTRQQILIKAKIVTIDESFEQTFGMLLASTTENTHNIEDEARSYWHTPRFSTQEGRANITIAHLGNGELLDLEIKALESEGRAHIIASPSLTTEDQQTASIQAGQEVPYQEKTGEGDTTTAFKKAVLGLSVTPTILQGQRISLHLMINQDTLSQVSVNGVPAIQTQQMDTHVTLKNHETLVLGGIAETSQQHTHERIPVLSRLPLIGRLFTQHDHLTRHKQLLIFITPVLL